MIKIFINELDYSDFLDTGFSIHENKDEELDLSSISLSYTNIENEFSPFDKVELYENDTLIKAMLVANDNVTLASKNPLLYTHDLQLIEITKLLERFFIDGKTFTQPIEEDSGYPPYTLLDVVMYLRASVPTRQIFEIANTGTTKPFYEPLQQIIFNIPEETKVELESVIAPEFTFKEVTLREALDEVVSYIDCNVYLDENENLRLNKFNELVEQVSSDDFIDRVLDRDIEYYSTNIETNVMNAVSKYDEGDINVEHFPSKNIFTNSKVSGNLWDYEGSFFVTNNPIYDVKSVNFKIEYSYEVFLGGIFQEEFEGIVDFKILDVFERQKAREFPTADSLTEAFDDGHFANTSLIYEYGKKNITLPTIDRVFSPTQGLKNVFHRAMKENAKILGEKISGVSDGEATYNPVLENTSRYNMDELAGDYIIFTFSFPSTSEIENNNFSASVSYIPLKRTVRLNVEKDGISDTIYKSYIQGNQKLRIIDIERYADKNKAKINRLGLGELMLTQRVKNHNQALNLGDFTTDKFIVTQRELIFYKDFIQCKYSLQKSFNRSNQFVGIDSQIRQWEIGEDGRTVERNVNYDEYVEINLLDTYEVGNNNSFTINQNGTDKIINTLNPNYADFDPLYLMTVESKQDIDVGENTYIKPQLVLAFSKYTGGNQITIHTNLDDNVSVGERIERISRWGALPFDRYEQRPTLFPDEFGRAENLKFKLYDYSENSTYQLSTIQEYNDNSDIVPILDDSYMISENLCIDADLYIFKDNREKIALGITYHFITRTDGLIIGSKMTKRNNLVSNIANIDLKIRLYNDVWFTTRDKESVERFTNYVEEELNTNINESEFTVTINNNLNGYDSFAIVNEHGEPFILSNYPKKYLKFDFKRNREGIFYNNIPIEKIELNSMGIGDSQLTLNFGFNQALELETEGIGLSTVSLNFAFNQTLELESLGIGQSMVSLDFAFNQGLELESKGIGESNITLDMIPNPYVELQSQGIGQTTLSLNFDRPVDWADGGTTLTAQNVCTNESHVNNTRVKSTTTVKTWVTIRDGVGHPTTDPEFDETAEILVDQSLPNANDYDEGDRVYRYSTFLDAWTLIEVETVTTTQYEICKVAGL